MDRPSENSPQASDGKRNKLLVVLGTAIICFIAIAFWSLRSSKLSSSRLETTPERQSAGFLKEQITEVSEQLLGDFPGDIGIIKLAVRFHAACNNSNKLKMLVEQGLKYNPFDYDLCNMMAQTAFDRAEHDEAVEYWKKALEIQPGRYELYDNIAEALIFLGRNQEAVEELEKKINISRPSARSYYLLGQGYLQLEKYEKAKEYYQKSLEIDPKRSVVYYLLAKVHMRLKQPDKAEEYMAVYRKFNVKNKDRRRRESVKKRKGTIVDIYSSNVLEEHPGSLSKLCVLGSALYKNNQNPKKSRELLKKGEKAFDRAIKINPDNPYVYREFAFLYLSTDREFDKAKKLAEKAIALEESAENYFVLCNAYNRNKEPGKALKALEKAIELDPGNMLYRQIYNKMTGKSK